jgi:hypothetical protein
MIIIFPHCETQATESIHNRKIHFWFLIMKLKLPRAFTIEKFIFGYLSEFHFLVKKKVSLTFTFQSFIIFLMYYPISTRPLQSENNLLNEIHL